MRFGEEIRRLRRSKGMSLRELAADVGVGFTYLSKIENNKLDFADWPSENLIERLADALGMPCDELMLLAERIPSGVRNRILQRPAFFLALSRLDGEELDALERDLVNAR